MVADVRTRCKIRRENLEEAARSVGDQNPSLSETSAQLRAQFVKPARNHAENAWNAQKPY